jgi:D-alanine-D-alanine ligase
MTKTRIGVVRGGPCSEYEVSLRTGAAVINSLDKEKYEPLDIIISKGGIWHIHGLEIEPHSAVRRVDVIFNALHGYYGEDGKIQQILEAHGIPFTGSGSLSSAIAMAKHLAKETFRRAGLKTPAHVLLENKIGQVEGRGGVDATKALLLAHSKFALPYIVKPVSGGSSEGVSIVRSRGELADALEKAFEKGDSVLIEEFISGVEATVGVIEGFRGQALYTLPAVEIRTSGGFFDYEAKYGSKVEMQTRSLEIVPATFSPSIKKELEHLAIAAHEALGLSHYSRSDFIVSPHRGIFILETNSLPGLTDESLVPKALAAVGSSLSELADHLVSLALSR